MKTVVVIPAYKPDEALYTLARELTEAGFGVLVVNDGSGKNYRMLFDKVADIEGVKIIANEVNMGKGAALKKGFAHILEFYPECEYFITADADGQHMTKDIIRVNEELMNKANIVLAVRIRKGKIPFRSRFGNDLSKFVYTILTGHYFTDNQSGLRGFRIENLEWLTRVRGHKYDYELNMLFYADKQSISITTIPIEAIYIDGNSSSHFNPVKDTVRIYKRLFSTAWPTLATLYLWETAALLVSVLLRFAYFYISIMTCGFFATAICVVFYKYIVFRKFAYKDLLRTVVFSLVRFIIYTAIVAILHAITRSIPLFMAINIAAIVMLPLEYYFHKGMHVASYRDINKE